MPSAWIDKRTLKSGSPRYRVRYRFGGRGSPPKYGGSFKTMDEAELRREWVLGELAAMRKPDIHRFRQSDIAAPREGIPWLDQAALEDALREMTSERALAPQRTPQRKEKRMITVTFTPERETKRTWRFEEVLSSEYADPKVGTLYVQKGALGDMGYEKGDNLTVTIAVDGNPVSTPKKRAPRTRR